MPVRHIARSTWCNVLVWSVVLLMHSLFVVSPATAQDFDHATFAPSIGDVRLVRGMIVRAVEASEAEWPSTRRQLLEQLGKALPSEVAGAERSRRLERADDFLVGCRREHPAHYVFDELLKLIGAVDVTPLDVVGAAVHSTPEEWPARRERLLGWVRRSLLVGGKTPPDVLERCLSNVGTLLDSARLGRTQFEVYDGEAAGYSRNLKQAMREASPWLLHVWRALGPPPLRPSPPPRLLRWDSLPLNLALLALVLASPLLLRLARRRPRVQSLLQRAPRLLLVAGHITWLALVTECAVRTVFAIPTLFDHMTVFSESCRRMSWVRSQYDRPSVGQARIFPHDPDRGWAVSPLLDRQPTLTARFINTNSRGLRGKAEYDYAKKPGVVRIAILGDSYTFGMEEDDDETYAWQLQRALPQCEVINFGVAGYGPDQEIVYFEREVAKYQPDIVIMGFLSMDAARAFDRFSFGAKPCFAIGRDGRLALQGTPVPPPEQVVDGEFFRCKTLDFIEMVMARARFGRSSAVEPAVLEPLVGALFERFAASARQAGATPVFLYLPNCNEMEGSGPPTFEAFVESFCAARAERLINVHPVLRGAMQQGTVRGTWRAPHHYMRNESELIATTIASSLYAQGLLSKPATSRDPRAATAAAPQQPHPQSSRFPGD